MNKLDLLLTVILIIVLIGISFLLTAGIVYILTWAIGFEFSWKLSLAVWIISGFLNELFTIKIKIKK